MSSQVIVENINKTDVRMNFHVHYINVGEMQNFLDVAREQGAVDKDRLVIRGDVKGWLSATISVPEGRS